MVSVHLMHVTVHFLIQLVIMMMMMMETKAMMVMVTSVTVIISNNKYNDNVTMGFHVHVYMASESKKNRL